MVDGKAKLARENFCDGFGDCLPACPAWAITFEEREAPEYDETAVKANQKKMKQKQEGAERVKNASEGIFAKSQSRLTQWPVQIRLVPAKAPFFEGAELLIAADCTAYACANMHEEFMKGKTTIIGCPKLDAVDYSEKLTQIFRENDIRSITVVRMEVPCCGGLAFAAEKALEDSGKFIPYQVVTIRRPSL